MTLTAEGFLSKRLPEIRAELEATFEAQFGTDLNFSPETIFGQLVGIESEARSEYYAIAEDVYLSQYPSTASGVALDLLVALNGITRLPALPTTVVGYLSLAVGTTVPAGSRAKDGTTTYSLSGDVTYNTANAHGMTVSVSTATEGADYTVTIAGTSYTVTAGAGDTAADILTGLSATISVDHTVTLETSLSVHVNGPVPVSVDGPLTLDSVAMTGSFQADQTGPITLPIGALSGIETPIAGWVSVTTVQPALSVVISKQTANCGSGASSRCDCRPYQQSTASRRSYARPTTY